MPRFSKDNAAVRYDLRWKYASFSREALNDLYDKISRTSGYKMIVYDTFGSEWLKEPPVFAKITVKED